MKPILFIAALTGTLLSASLTLHAQTNAPAAVSPEDREAATITKHLKPILKALQLNDTNKEAKVGETYAAFFKAQTAWHAQNDDQLKTLWAALDQAHGKRDDAATDAAGAKIEEAYASFKPEHEKFLSGLSSVLTPAEVEKVKDALTINKVKVTYNAYGEIFHGLTDEQKAYILKELKAAREEAIDTASIKEVSAFFKKHKNKIEAYLTAQGYDVKQSYKDFVAKQKVEMPPKKPAQ